MADLLGQIGLGYADLFFLALIFIGWPLAGELGKAQQGDADTPKTEPLDVYNSSIILLWATALPILIAWPFLARPWSSLGLSYESGPIMTGAFIIVGAIITYHLVQLIRALVSEKVRANLHNRLLKMKDTVYLAPRNGKEYRRAMMLAVTAGVTEEIVFRGYLIWALSQFMHLWLAAIIVVAHFVFLHRYQGWRGMRQVFLITVTVTVLYIVTGSLAASIVLHILIDVINISRLALSFRETSEEQADS